MSQGDFLRTQLSFQRVRSAEIHYDLSIQKLFQKNGLSFPPKQLYIRAFKQEQKVEVWASDRETFSFVKTYDFTATSGKPGPKQREGDGQIPEGFYHITNFNPESRFHLSFRINYPNQADITRNRRETHPGSDIYFHGGEETVGCIPIGDDNMAELYWLCVQSFTDHTYITVHIFPCKMEAQRLSSINKEFPEHIDFWNSMLSVYERFQSQHILFEPDGCDEKGNYLPVIPPRKSAPAESSNKF